MAAVSKECEVCRRFYTLTAGLEESSLKSPCGHETAKVTSWPFTNCPFCDCKQFYRRKGFNQTVGCSIILLGALLVPVTYGLSLPLLVLVDWLLARRVPDIMVCYRCGTEFNDFGEIPQTVAAFDHHTGELYEAG